MRTDNINKGVSLAREIIALIDEIKNLFSEHSRSEAVIKSKIRDSLKPQHEKFIEISDAYIDLCNKILWASITEDARGLLLTILPLRDALLAPRAELLGRIDGLQQVISIEHHSPTKGILQAYENYVFHIERCFFVFEGVGEFNKMGSAISAMASIALYANSEKNYKHSRERKLNLIASDIIENRRLASEAYVILSDRVS